jgi:hypothetical protein
MAESRNAIHQYHRSNEMIRSGSKLGVVLILYLCGFALAQAHEVRPAYLEVRQTAADTYDVLWKVPAAGENLRLGVYVRFPGETRELAPPQGIFADGAYVERSRVQLPGGLAGRVIHFDGLAATKIDVLARVDLGNRATQTTRIMPDAPEFTVETTPTSWNVSRTYLVLGIEHILLGIDHLLFVLALVLLVNGKRRLMGTITAFTLAHSITLVLAT